MVIKKEDLADMVIKNCGRTAELFGSRGCWVIEQPIEKGMVSTEWECIGEGWNGDFDKDDPDDEELLRFTILLNEVQIEDASYCTQTPVNTSDEIQVRLLIAIHLEAVRGLEGSDRIKETMERMSWISPEDLIITEGLKVGFHLKI